MTDPLIVIRGLHFAASVIVCGTVCFIVLVARPPAESAPASFAKLCRSTNVLAWFMLALALVTGAAWLLFLAAQIFGTSIIEAGRSGGVWTVLTETRFGWIWSIRFVLALLLAACIGWPRVAAIRLLIAAAFLALLAFTGHAGAAPGTAGTVHLVSDIAHLLAAGAWLGALPAFVLALGVNRREDDWSKFTIRATGRFSILGALSVAILLASGLLNSWNLLGRPQDLLTTGYGRLIAIKIGLFAAMTAIAVFNKFSLTPRLPDPRALRDLRRGSIAEICLGLGVLSAVAALGLMEPTAHVHSNASAIPPDAAFVHIHDPAAMADVTIEPGRVGWASATIRVSREDFSPYPAKVVKLALESPQHIRESFEQTATENPDGTWIVPRVKLAHSGIWTVRVTVMNRSEETITLDAPIVIER
jgi:putative copper resistance protein D